MEKLSLLLIFVGIIFANNINLSKCDVFTNVLQLPYPHLTLCLTVQKFICQFQAGYGITRWPKIIKTQKIQAV